MTTTVDGKPVDYAAGGLIPEHMRSVMKRYIEERIPPGDFLEAVLANDLFGAVRRADEINRAALHRYPLWLYNHAPPLCYGTREKVQKWLNER